MDINFLGLIGSLIRLIFVFKFDVKKQQNASKLNFEKEENRDILAGIVVIIIIIAIGLLAFG